MNSLALLPNLAGPDGLIILLVLVFFFGAKKIPEVARGLGSAMREFSKGKNGDDNEKPAPPASLP